MTDTASTPSGDPTATLDRFRDAHAACRRRGVIALPPLIPPASLEPTFPEQVDEILGRQP